MSGPWPTVWTWHPRVPRRGPGIGCCSNCYALLTRLAKWFGRLSVDSTIARAHQHATNITRVTGASSSYKNPQLEPLDHAFGRSRGRLSTKIHHLVDGNGRLLVVLLTPGQAGDSPMFLPLMDQLRATRAGGGKTADPTRLGPGRQGVVVPRDPRSPDPLASLSELFRLGTSHLNQCNTHDYRFLPCKGATDSDWPDRNTEIVDSM